MFCRFGVRRKNGYNPGSAGSEFGERMGITLVWQVRSSEKGQFLSPNSEPWQVRSKNWAAPWFCRFGVRRKASSLSPNSEPWQVRSSEKEPGQSLVRQLRSLEKGHGRTLVWQVRSSEKGPSRTLVWQVWKNKKKK